CQQYNGLPFTF
nr:immunoglobulin light chain junction region [Macaca mulatta]